MLAKNMTKSAITIKIQELQKEIKYHDDIYHNQNRHEISDYEYDLKKKELEKLLSLNSEDSLFSNVGIDVLASVGAKTSNKFAKIHHKIPMLSLDNAFEIEDVMNFDTKIKRFLHTNENLEYIAELKIDGLSFSAFYENGDLKYVATRGDGEIGEDVTTNVAIIHNFPSKINYNGIIPRILEIRGEIYISHKTFREINEQQLQNSDKIFASPRNAASGTLRNLDLDVIKSRNLQYFAYGITQINDNFELNIQSAILHKLQEFGFIVNQNYYTGKLENCINFYKDIEKKRYEIDFDIDGVVYKINDLNLQKRLGNTNKSPRWAIAHKFSGLTAVTKIIDVVNQVGRMGNITPVAQLEPVNIGGVIIKRATLHNFDEIERLGVRIGDIVNVTRAGDVIPQIISVIEQNGIEDIKKPEFCPCCKAKLMKDEDLVALYCTNSDSCDEQIIQKIEHFCSKDAFDISGLGDKQIRRFYELNLIRNIVDIFNLAQHRDFLIKLDRFGEKSIENLLNSIENIKIIDFAKFLYSLSIKNIGTGFAENLAKKFKNVENLIASFKDFAVISSEIDNISGFGDKISTEIKLFFTNARNQDIICELNKMLTIKPYPEVNKDAKFSGKKIIFTGTLQKMDRQEAKKIAKSMGFEIVSSISKNTDFIVCGENAGSKLTKANELGVQIIYEDEWLKMCNFTDFTKNLL